MTLAGGAQAAVTLAQQAHQDPLIAARYWHPVCTECRRPLRPVAGRGPHDFVCVGHDCPARHRLVEASSQRMPLSTTVDLALGLFGGNGAGKTHFVAALARAVASGSDSPAVAAWMRANSIAPDLIPPKGGLVVCSSLTSALGKVTLREKVAEVMPKGSTWRNKDGAGEAEVVPADAQGNGRVLFKSNDQGREKFQGFKAALIVLDEEHDRAVYEECTQRLSRFRWTTPAGDVRSGYMVLSMTPLKGLTWVYEDFVDPDTRKPGTRTAFIWGENNPYLDQKARQVALDNAASEALRAARDRGTFGMSEGLIYRSWRRGVHVVEPFKVDFSRPGWYAYEGIDFGDRNPFSYGLYAYDADSDHLYRIAEHYAAETLLSEHARIIKEIRARHHVPPGKLTTIADPAQRAQRRSLAYEHDMATIAAQKDVIAGIRACQERLRYSAVVDPGFYCFSTCTAFIKEIEGYRWLERKVKTDQPEQPLKKDDHAMDEWRYVCMAVAMGL